jgi:hypothetical protein
MICTAMEAAKGTLLHRGCSVASCCLLYCRLGDIAFVFTRPSVPNQITHGDLRSAGCGVAQIGCGVAQIIARRLAVRQARVRISARHPRGGFLLSGSYEENKSGTRKVIYIYKYCMYSRSK